MSEPGRTPDQHDGVNAGAARAESSPSEPLTREHVERIARLSRLALEPERVEAYRTSLSAIVAYVDRLRTLDVRGVEPLTNPADVRNRVAPDEPGPTLPTEALVAMAPASMPPFVRIPKVIDGSGGGA